LGNCPRDWVKQIATRLKQAREITDVAQGRSFTDDERERLKYLLWEMKAIKARLDESQRTSDFRTELDAIGRMDAPDDTTKGEQLTLTDDPYYLMLTRLRGHVPTRQRAARATSFRMRLG
jgi:hypothetical protein